MSKKVLCGDCGFLCWDISDVKDSIKETIRWGEVSQFHREELAAGSIKASDDDYELHEHYLLSCLR